MEEIDLYLKKIRSDSKFKGAFGRAFTRINYLNYNTSKKLRNRICKDVVMSVPCVFYTRKDLFLLGEMNKLIGDIVAAGLIKFWNRKFAEEVRIPEAKELKVLTVHEMSGSIQIWIFGCMTSFVVFVLEVLIKAFQRYVKEK